MTTNSHNIPYNKLFDQLKRDIRLIKHDFLINKDSIPNLDKIVYSELIQLSDETINARTPEEYHQELSLQNKNLNMLNYSLSNKHTSYKNINNDKNPISVGVNNLNQNKSDNILTSSLSSYQCNFSGCLKSYTSIQGLKYHKQFGHLKNRQNAYKPYVCPIEVCEKSYKNSNGLKYHLDKVHPEYQ